ncbi:hypothetical protein D3C80_587220 [compost metagenome]
MVWNGSIWRGEVVFCARCAMAFSSNGDEANALATKSKKKRVPGRFKETLVIGAVF